jgi:tetratricopeptide (TPR) repeat protein
VQAKALVAIVLIVIALLAWLIGIVMTRRLVFSLDPILIASLLIPIAYAASALISGNPLSSFVSGDALTGTVASVLLFFGAALIGALSVEDRKHSFTLLVALLISAAVVIVFQIARLIFPGHLDLFGALAGNTSSVVGSWHDLAIFVGTMLLIALGLLESSVAESKPFAIALQVMSVLGFGLLLIINFSDTWFMICGGATFFAVARLLRSYRRSRSVTISLRSSILWIVLALVALGIGLGGTFIYNHLPKQLQITQVEVRPSWQGTFQAGQEIFSGGRALIFGTGPNTFDQQWALNKPKEVNGTNFWNTDFQSGIGVVPTAFVTVGIVGTIGWLLLALALLYAGYRSIVDESEGRLRVILFVASAALLTFHIIYVPSFGISTLMFLLLGVLAGLNTSSWRNGVVSLTPSSIGTFIGILIIACAVIAGGLMESRAIISTLFTSKAAAVYQQSSDLSAASQLVAQAVSIDPQNDIAQRAAIEIGLLQLAKLSQNGAASTTQEQLKAALSSTIAHGLAAVNIDNTNYQNWLALAGLYQSLAGQGVAGAYDQAQTAWQHAASTTPSNPLPQLQLGEIALVRNDLAGAKMYFSKAISLKPDLALPYYLRSQIEANAADWKNAGQDAYNAAQLANQDPLGWYNLGVILYAAGDTQDAGAALEKAVSLQNNYSDALFALAVIYDKVGAHANAIAAAQKVVDLNPSNALAVEVLQNLQQGKSALDGLQQGQSSTATPSTSKNIQKKK